MLRNPGQPYDFNGRRETYPDIRLIYWAGGNPFHHHQDLNGLHEAWQKPETIIVNEPWWTATAKRADIVFPATTPYEREDIGRSNLDDYLFHMPRLIPPVGEARDDYEIFSGLARRMGVESTFTEGRDAAEWIRVLYEEYRSLATDQGLDVPDFETLKEKNWIRLPIRRDGPNRTLVRAVPRRSGRVSAQDAVGQDRDLLRDDRRFRIRRLPGTPTLAAADGMARKRDGIALRFTLSRRSRATSCTASWKARSRMSRARGPWLCHPSR